MEPIENTKLNKTAGATDHLANERTFLAWIRTSIALMGFGFVIVKFALFVRQVSLALGSNKIPPPKGYSAQIGVGMVALGALIALLAYIHYRNTEKQLNTNNYYPSQWLSTAVTIAIIIASILLIIYLLPNL
jgi:putative membrane protein